MLQKRWDFVVVVVEAEANATVIAKRWVLFPREQSHWDNPLALWEVGQDIQGLLLIQQHTVAVLFAVGLSPLKLKLKKKQSKLCT